MLFGWSKTGVSPIAIDFGADSLKLLQVMPTDPPQLIAAAAQEVPEAARSDPAARHAFFADALRQLLKSQPFKGRRASCSLPAYQTLVQHLQVPSADPASVQEQIAMHLRERLNIDPGRMIVRHFMVGPVSRDGGNKEEVICLAASRDAVMSHIETARRAKLDVVGMHGEPLVILRAFAHLYRRADDAQRTTCFIDLGAATTKVVIAHGRDMVFAKTIHAAGDHFNRHLAKVAGLSFSEARQRRMAEAAAAPARPATEAVEALKPPPRPTGGLAVLEAQIEAERRSQTGTATAVAPPPATPAPADGFGEDARSRPKAGGAVLPLMAEGDTLDCLIDELQLCVRYHQGMFPNRPIEKLVFLGGEAHHVATCQRIARALRIGAQLGDPLARVVRTAQGAPPVGVDTRRPQPGWTVPLGLCLSEANL